MPRFEDTLATYRDCVEVSVTETWTLRVNLPNGTILRGDGKDFWHNGRCAYYGKAPAGWDDSKAYVEEFTRHYETELDYS
jgi:hypothetical protein